MKGNLKTCKPRLLYPVELYFKDQGQIKTFWWKLSTDQWLDLRTSPLPYHHSLFTDKELGQEVRHWPKVPFRAGLLQCIPLAGPGPCTTGPSCQTADASGSGSQLSHWERSARPTYEGAPSLPVVGDDSPMKTQGALLLVRSLFFLLQLWESPKWPGRVGRGSLDHWTKRQQSTPWDWVWHSSISASPEPTGLGARKPHCGPAWAQEEVRSAVPSDQPSDRCTVRARARDGQRPCCGLNGVPQTYVDFLTPGTCHCDLIWK